VRNNGRTIRGYVLAFTASALVANAVLGERGAVEMLRARREHRAVAEAVTKLRAENAQLRVETRLLRTDRSTIESIARQELGLLQPGELMIVIARNFTSAPMAQD